VEAGQVSQPPLFELPDLPTPGWHPSDLGAGTHLHWASPAEIESRLDAAYYVITRRPERRLDGLNCPLSPLEEWAAVNPAERRLPTERGYLLYEECLYAQVGDVRDGCWLLGPGLSVKAVRDLPVRAAYLPEPDDLLLPLVYSSLHKAVLVLETDVPLVTSSAFALLKPRSRAHGLALLGLLHHRVLGEQLWALASGTMVRSVSVGKVGSLQVPQIAPGQRAALASQVEAALYAQQMVHFPGLRTSLSWYWQDGSMHYWQRQMQVLAWQVEEAIDQVLGAQA
jgi:hypothetical protein